MSIAVAEHTQLDHVSMLRKDTEGKSVCDADVKKMFASSALALERLLATNSAALSVTKVKKGADE